MKTIALLTFIAVYALLLLLPMHSARAARKFLLRISR